MDENPLTIPSTNTVIWAVVIVGCIYYAVKNDVLGIRSRLGLEPKRES